MKLASHTDFLSIYCLYCKSKNVQFNHCVRHFIHINIISLISLIMRLSVFIDPRRMPFSISSLEQMDREHFGEIFQFLFLCNSFSLDGPFVQFNYAGQRSKSYKNK